MKVYDRLDMAWNRYDTYSPGSEAGDQPSLDHPDQRLVQDFRLQIADLNARIRTEGTRNLIEAARRSGSPKTLAQSVAWQLPDGPDAQAVAERERSVLAEGGVVLRYGQFYGPGTYNAAVR